MATIQKQEGTNDCGLFSIASAVELAKKGIQLNQLHSVENEISSH